MSTGVNFENIYQGESDFGDVTQPGGVLPWDIGEPQPELVALVDAGQVTGDVLDAGCGVGNNSTFLAERGLRVTGVDFSSAIEQARQRAEGLDNAPEFVVEDATRLDGLSQRFSTILDSALYHCLDDQQRRDYAAALHRVSLPGAVLHLFCAADVDNPGCRMPMVVTPENLRANLGEHWDVSDIALTRYTSAFTPEILRQIPQDSLAAAGIELDIDDVEVDEHDRVLLPVWHLRASRR